MVNLKILPKKKSEKKNRKNRKLSTIERKLHDKFETLGVICRSSIFYSCASIGSHVDENDRSKTILICTHHTSTLHKKVKDIKYP